MNVLTIIDAMKVSERVTIYIIIATVMLTAIAVQATPRRVLNMSNLEIGPNPFSPHSEFYSNGAVNYGMRVKFEVDSFSTFVWLTAKVHNMDGTVVRTIYRLEPKYTAENKMGPAEITFWWDGRDDFGNLANNGRYILHLRLSDTEAETFSTEKIKSVVLVK